MSNEGAGGRSLNELTSRDVHEYLREGGDLAIVPVGSTECVGPHLPVGARTYVVEALALLLGRRCGGLVVPPMPYAPVLGTDRMPGSVDVSPRVLIRFLFNLFDELVANGFGRIVMVSSLREDYDLVNDYYERRNLAAAACRPWVRGVDVRQIVGPEAPETSIVLGALNVLGRGDLVDKVLRLNAEYLGREELVSKPSGANFDRLSDIAQFGYRFDGGFGPVAPVTDPSAERGAKYLEAVAEALAPGIEALDAYNAWLARIPHTRGLGPASKLAGW